MIRYLDADDDQRCEVQNPKKVTCQKFTLFTYLQIDTYIMVAAPLAAIHNAIRSWFLAEAVKWLTLYDQ